MGFDSQQLNDRDNFSATTWHNIIMLVWHTPVDVEERSMLFPCVVGGVDLHYVNSC